MQGTSGITAISFGVSEIATVGLLGLLVAALVFWVIRRARRKGVDCEKHTPR